MSTPRVPEGARGFCFSIFRTYNVSMYNFTSFKKSVAEVANWLRKEYQGIRTGRATPALLDNVFVEVYGSRMPITQTATVTVEDARSLRVTPWDLANVKAIERAVADANIGVSASADDRGVRVSFPELTSERRESLLKIARAKLEDARVSLRGERDKVWHDIQERERAGEMGEDDKFRAKDEMQKIVDAANEELEDIAEKKEKEIRS